MPKRLENRNGLRHCHKKFVIFGENVGGLQSHFASAYRLKGSCTNAGFKQR